MLRFCLCLVLLIFLTPLISSSLIPSKNNTEQLFFNTNTTGVLFNLHVRHNVSGNALANDIYSESEVTAMLQVISTRFSRIITLRTCKVPALLSEWSTYDCGDQIPISAAQLNKLGLLPTQLDILLIVHESPDESQARVNLEHAFNLATIANKIHPNTVSTIMLDGDHVRRTSQTALQTLQYAHHLRQSNDLLHFMQIGVWMHLVECGIQRSALPKYTLDVLQLLDVVLFHELPSDPQVKRGPIIAVKDIMGEFTRCTERIRSSLNKTVNISLTTEWASDGELEGYTLPNQIAYWKLMSDAVAGIGSSVFFRSAFDVPYQGSSIPRFSHGGWWKLKRKDEVNITNTVFVEKASLISEAETAKDKESSILSVSSATITSFVALGVILLAVAAGLIFFYYTKGNVLNERLSKEDCDEFIKGGKGKRDSGPCLDIMNLPYNTEMELPKECFVVDYETLLGKGAFGCIYKGNIQGINKEAAFKVTKTSCCALALKGLLSEIKVMSYLGRHEHIVELIGAYTAELRIGRVYVVMELCEGGSLEAHLRRRCSNTEEYVNPPEHSSNQGNLQEDMLRWSLEIASGMEYIASKNVVHADLATRNILLTSSYTTKISDFGLSRRMYNYTNYLKKQEEPMPWRWMSIEALKHLTFSEKSDVWSFGCTMWEIYSGGDVPYSGLSWSVSFVDELQKGLRLQCPLYASKEIYDLMQQCWITLPMGRICFKDLENSLKDLIVNQIKMNL